MDLKVTRMFNLLFNSKILASNTFKSSFTALLGTSYLFFNASALAGDDTFMHGRHLEEHNTHSQSARQFAIEMRQNAKSNSEALTKALALYRDATEQDKSHYLSQMMSLAEERQQLLSELVEVAPADVASLALSSEERQGAPEEVRELLEQEQVLDGELEVYYEDYEDHSKSRLYHVLKTADGHIELHMKDRAQLNAVHSGMRVRASGWRFEKHEGEPASLVLNESLQSLTVLADGSVSTTEISTTSSALNNTLGDQKTLVMLVNFQSNPQQPWTVGEVEEVVFGSVNDYFQEVSYGQTLFSGDVQGYYTLPIDEVCDLSTISTYANQAAEDSGIDVASYNRLMYVFPQSSKCGWTGRGTVGGNPSRSWINGSLTLRTVAHELGHNLGLHHAEKLECETDVVEGNCYSVEYGDSLDIMGAPNFTGHFNSFSKDILGWLNTATDSHTDSIVEIKSEGSYFLEPYETLPGGQSKALKIQRGVDPSTGEKLWYYLEYRQAVGFDRYLVNTPSLISGVTFHLGREGDRNTSQLLDMTPNSASADWNDSSLVPGNSYSDLDAGITVTTEWADSTGASVYVSFAEATCTSNDPSITVVPLQSAGVSSGSTLSYTVSVTNNDSNGCSSSDFAVEAFVPSGWITTAASLNLVPGASDTVILDVTSNETAADGSYDITFNASNSSDSNFNASATSSYLVETPVQVCQLSAPLLTVTANQTGVYEPGSKMSYTVTVTSQDSGECEPAMFDLAVSVPDGWNANDTTMTLAPDESNTLYLDVASSTDASDGNYNVTFLAQHTSEPGFSVSEVESVVIESAVEPNGAPVAVNDEFILSAKEPVVIDVLINDSDPDGDSLSITSVTQGSKGTVQITSGGQLLYTPAKSFKGNDSFSYSITDGYETSTAVVTIGMESSNGNGGKGKK
ncbi:NPCBM-associated, NEW3 domain of alpha-galactosidase [Vibrio hangzhouensis]|uniref:NPCBM-associated, NEW3 domain of alpha-galactosidase n=2 Tax=Vibrio hangzhouensis TaxID=462991 RepID=A0A1H5WYL9_9VIBR|nr:NPCBM-associated, NEW3 domain of alpha-galactosidase [Vibrio hangzhouensis]